MAVGCDRSTIESYTGNEKEPVLLYLDEARRTADEVMELLAADRFDEIYKRNKSLTIFVPNKTSGEMVTMSLPAFRQDYGRLARYEYRNQHLLYNFYDSIELRGTAGTWYELMPANSKRSDRTFIWVETHKYKVGYKPGVLSLGIRKWGKNTAPPWEYYEAGSKKRKGCFNMKDRLKVRLD